MKAIANRVKIINSALMESMLEQHCHNGHGYEGFPFFITRFD
jgi:hypothetical protein